MLAEMEMATRKSPRPPLSTVIDEHITPGEVFVVSQHKTLLGHITEVLLNPE